MWEDLQWQVSNLRAEGEFYGQAENLWLLPSKSHEALVGTLLPECIDGPIFLCYVACRTLWKLPNMPGCIS